MHIIAKQMKGNCSSKKFRFLWTLQWNICEINRQPDRSLNVRWILITAHYKIPINPRKEITFYFYINIALLTTVVPLNRSCVHHMQCSGSPNAACLNGKCDCIPGYITDNSSHCVLGMFFFFFSLFLRRGRGYDFFALFISLMHFFIDLKRQKYSLQCYILFIYI